MPLSAQNIEDILIRGDYVPEKTIASARSTAKAQGISVADYLIAQGLLTRDLLGQAVAEYYNVPYADLNSNQPSREQVLRIPEKIAKKFNILIFAEEGEKLAVTTDDPRQKGLASQLRRLFPKKQLVVAYSLPEDIDAAFVYYRKSLETRFSQIIKEDRRIAPEILQEIFADALVFRASDIHFEPQAKEVLVRFRIDGVLQEAGRLPKEHYENILNRIKVLAHLRIDEHFAAQDGSIRYRINERSFDLRVSIIPIIDGEKVVVRVLAQYVQDFRLSDLGLGEREQELLQEAAQKPFGMILITGPTGSGKTTTLYALLKMLNTPEVNITTIEDPVEYKIQGVNQIQVNPQTELTFAKGLRSIVRQDPNIILVGEIRDEETAQIAVNAALTGHRLLSTFHANDAATTIPRLLEMGTEPFLLASTLQLVAAQRLVRRLCEQCRYSETVALAKLKTVFKDASKYFSAGKTTLYNAKGCNACGHTGFSGRMALFEFISITPEMEAFILTNPSTQEVWALARKQGSRSLFEDGITKVKNGVTTLEELLRVATPPDAAAKS